jgi:cytochrome c
MLVMETVIADLDDDAPVALSGMAEFAGVGHDARESSAQPAAPVDTDYQVRLAFVQPGISPQPVARRHGWAIKAGHRRSSLMHRPVLIALAAIALTGCGQGQEASAPVAPARPAPTAVDRAALLAALPAPYDTADLDNGRRAFARCRSCHTITEGGPNMTGPNLYGLFGRQAGVHPGFNYSAAVKDAGFAWDGERLDHWLENPRTFLKGTKMSFAGIPDPTDRRDVIAFLKVETGYTPPAP